MSLINILPSAEKLQELTLPSCPLCKDVPPWVRNPPDCRSQIFRVLSHDAVHRKCPLLVKQQSETTLQWLLKYKTEQQIKTTGFLYIIIIMILYFIYKYRWFTVPLYRDSGLLAVQVQQFDGTVCRNCGDASALRVEPTSSDGGLVISWEIKKKIILKSLNYTDVLGSVYLNIQL